MTIHNTRILPKLIIMLCVCTCMQAALNFVQNNTPTTNNNSAQPQKKALATQIDAAPAPAPSKVVPTPQAQDLKSAPQAPKLPVPKKAVKDTVTVQEDNSEEETVEFHFEDADLQNLLNQMASLYEVVFLTDDIITPPVSTAKAIKGNKISFKTNKPLTRETAWNLFLTFLEIAGFSLTKETEPNIYRVVTLDAAKKSPIPSYIGIKADKLPKNDQMIRYVYFVQNTSVETLDPIIQALRSNVSGYLVLKDLQAFMLTDKAYNIVSLMEIVNELDKVTMPQSMSVLKLRRANAQDVKDLYDSLTQAKEDKGVTARLFPSRKPSTAVYFPENLRIVVYPRTNALILLGAEDAIKKIEEFITLHVDVDITAPYPPIRVHNLRYADATRVAEIMNSMTSFGKDTEAGKSGGVRGGDKYIKKMLFTPEPETNRLIIQGDEADYQSVKEVLAKLDEQQPQVAIEVLILNVRLDNVKQLGAQLRSKIPGPNGLLGDTVKFQTSGLYGTSGIQLNKATAPDPGSMGADRLLANLIDLAVGAPTGNTLVTLGSDLYGVWGLFQALQTVTNTQIIGNPFLVATNKTPASVEVGEIRRVVVATVVGQQDTQSRDDLSAALVIKITPQINSDGMIVLDLVIDINNFTNAATSANNATRNIRQLNTTTIVSNGEVLALGGLIQNRSDMNQSETPILGKIPILGWLFKNKARQETKDNLLIMICPRILPPDSDKEAIQFTNDRILGYHTSLADMMIPSDDRDPIHKFFFEPKSDSSSKVMDDFLFNRHNNTSATMREPKEQLKRNQRAKKRSHRRRQSNNADTPIQKNDNAILALKTNDPTQDNLIANNTMLPDDQKLTPLSQRSRRSLSAFIADAEPQSDAMPEGIEQ